MLSYSLTAAVALIVLYIILQVLGVVLPAAITTILIIAIVVFIGIAVFDAIRGMTPPRV